ncbi:hypothetical protein BGX34_008882 [Mortierella sp. NVP85]|nr:hypothetical protein BGX34_008882 [Mortierella sp. NVP85]
MWNDFPGKLQSVSVADVNNMWGVTLDLQLCKFHTETRQWRLVSVTTEHVNQSRFSATSAVTNDSRSSAMSSSPNTTSFSRAISSLLPSLRPPSPSPSLQQQESSFKNRDSSSLSSDSESDTTIAVSAASDGTVVRLDKTQRSWYLINPHGHHDFEKEVLWIDLGQSWKCVSVASVSQIWGLSDQGEIYYGTTDRFVLLESSITSGAGYGKPTFTQISVGHDSLVLATDAHSGTVFRLKTHPTASHPPIWTAIPGTGSGISQLHIVHCSLSTADFIVGIALDGQAYRFRNSKWIPMSGSVRLDSVGVGVDGYVLGVGRNGDLFSCQLQSTLFISQSIPDRIKSSNPYNKDDDAGPNSPQAPNLPDIPPTPHIQAVSKRPVASPRELFEMGTSDRGYPFTNYSRATNDELTRNKAGPRAEIPSPLATGSNPCSNSLYARYKHGRSNSQHSKSSYASDVGTTSLKGSKDFRSASLGFMDSETRGKPSLEILALTTLGLAADQREDFNRSNTNVGIADGSLSPTAGHDGRGYQSDFSAPYGRSAETIMSSQLGYLPISADSSPLTTPKSSLYRGRYDEKNMDRIPLPEACRVADVSGGKATLLVDSSGGTDLNRLENITPLVNGDSREARLESRFKPIGSLSTTPVYHAQEGRSEFLSTSKESEWIKNHPDRQFPGRASDSDVNMGQLSWSEYRKLAKDASAREKLSLGQDKNVPSGHDIHANYLLDTIRQPFSMSEQQYPPSPLPKVLVPESFAEQKVELEEYQGKVIDTRTLMPRQQQTTMMDKAIQGDTTCSTSEGKEPVRDLPITRLNHPPSNPMVPSPPFQDYTPDAPLSSAHRMSQSLGMVALNPGGSAVAVTASGANGTETAKVLNSTPSGGIQGEDADGRWIESPTDIDPRVERFDPSTRKCCNIL